MPDSQYTNKRNIPAAQRFLRDGGICSCFYRLNDGTPVICAMPSDEPHDHRQPADETADFIRRIARDEVATGVSSRAMAWAALGWTESVGGEMPYDGGDWGRCVQTYTAAPPELRARMTPVMELYHQRLLDHHEHTGFQDWRLRGVVWPLPTDQSLNYRTSGGDRG